MKTVERVFTLRTRAVRQGDRNADVQKIGAAYGARTTHTQTVRKRLEHQVPETPTVRAPQPYLPQPLPRLDSRSDQWIAGPAVALWGIRTSRNFIKSPGVCVNFLVFTQGLRGPVFQILQASVSQTKTLGASPGHLSFFPAFLTGCWQFPTGQLIVRSRKC